MQFTELAQSFKATKEPHSEVVLTGTIPAEALEPYRTPALSHLAEHLTLPGFRKGKVPAEMMLKRLGEISVLEESVELFVRDFYPELALGKKLDVVGRPDIQVLKLAPGNPVELRIRTAVYPDVTLPKNWQKLAAGVAHTEAKEATDEEVSQTLESLRKSRTNADLTRTDADAKDVVLPELNDEFARSLGAFKDLEDLKAQIRKGIGEEKARQAKDTRRGNIIEALIEKTTADMPKLFVESELEKIMAQMQDDVARMGMQLPEYLKRTGKTEEDIRNDFRGQAEKRAKLQLLLNKLAQEEKVEADQEAVEAEMKHATEHFPDADPERVRIHVESVLRNEKVLKLLEEQQ